MRKQPVPDRLRAYGYTEVIRKRDLGSLGRIASDSHVFMRNRGDKLDLTD
jgi:hypothetical protein